MAIRCVYCIEEGMINQVVYEMEWVRGFSRSSALQNSEFLRDIFTEDYPTHKVLEASTASDTQLGVALSAFNLKSANGITVEAQHQGSKVHYDGQVDHDLYHMSGKAAKGVSKVRRQKGTSHFNYFGKEYYVDDFGIMFNWIYLNALKDNPELREQLKEYTAFTDIFYNPQTLKACQAMGLVIYTAVMQKGIFDEVIKSPEHLARLVYGKIIDTSKPTPAMLARQKQM